ncbi:lipase maturation factor family protein [Halorarius halobius]|uniref:lipase maturation factor family protein n=1 Tax=Halorarius halobius TaxID=2962671 RepID=UPI0020CBB678|nr:lipase maturation factor family protein [Halorarius halobius]
MGFVELWGLDSLWLPRLLLKRGVAVTYLLAFLVAARQFRPLAGEDGLLPIDRYVEHATLREEPSLFYLYPSDRAIGAAAWAGVALSVGALVGVTEAFGTPVSMLAWTAMWLLYLSFVNAGQTFYGFGWESLLLETGFLCIFLGAGTTATPWVVMLLLRWVLFRNVFGAGLIKLRGDDCWRDLTCLDYHYETQPMPNPASWFAHHLPKRVHRAGVVVNHVVELAVPFLYFAPQPIAGAAGAVTIAFMGWLMVTGNFSWLNSLSIVLAVSAFSDPLLAPLWPLDLPAVAPAPAWLWGLALALAALVVALSYYPVRNLVSDRQAMNAAFDPLHLVNTYGAFGSITRDRYELVVEGTRDDDLSAADWEPYTFPGKPTRVDRRPPQVAPYHLRLDWQMWFAAMPTRRRHPWLHRLVAQLLEADEGALSLLRSDPFDGDPPEYVRIERYRYEFTDPAERRETGDWWRREKLETVVQPVSAEEIRRYGVAGQRW